MSQVHLFIKSKATHLRYGGSCLSILPALGGGGAEAGGSPGIGGQPGLHSGEKMRDPISKSKHTQPIYIASKMLYNIEKS